jgi:hypothetical protein
MKTMTEAIEDITMETWYYLQGLDFKNIPLTRPEFENAVAAIRKALSTIAHKHLDPLLVLPGVKLPVKANNAILWEDVAGNLIHVDKIADFINRC